MPWKESVIMDERMKFIGRLLDGEKMTDLCQEFGISRKTGYKFWERYKSIGLGGLSDRTRRPMRYANQLPMQVEKTIVKIKKNKPSWGAPKIREILRRKYPEIKIPAKSTVHCVLDRHGLVKRRRRRRFKAQGTTLSNKPHPNDLWCTDYKGEFMLANRQYCYPLTITDFSSRYLLACEGIESTKMVHAFSVFEQIFSKYGLPKAIRTDNGLPFSSATSLFGLSKLSVWWLRLGIAIERIKPGCPQQNGRHERMHLTLKKEATKPPGENLLQQQEKFDKFIVEFNNQRPHQALAMKYPNELYKSSPRPYKGIGRLDYPFSDRIVTVTHCGRICIRKKKIHLSQAFAGQDVGIKEINDDIWQVTFMNYDLGFFDLEAGKFEPSEYPFIPERV
ncbi:MAG: transposase [Candidatus Omnitrophica bacterium]|nr:transposase [Candidatus Omnitrophota bacterium]